MNNEEFLTAVDAKLTDCYKLLKDKNIAYSSNLDPMNNFNQFAKLTGTTPQDALLSFAGKQVVQIYNKQGRQNDPTYKERIMDVINYFAILLGMLDE